MVFVNTTLTHTSKEKRIMYLITYLVTYEGQKESPYHWSSPNLSIAMCLLDELEEEYPDRVWRIEEKDVS